MMWIHVLNKNDQRRRARHPKEIIPGIAYVAVAVDSYDPSV